MLLIRKDCISSLHIPGVLTSKQELPNTILGLDRVPRTRSQQLINGLSRDQFRVVCKESEQAKRESDASSARAGRFQDKETLERQIVELGDIPQGCGENRGAIYCLPVKGPSPNIMLDLQNGFK